MLGGFWQAGRWMMAAVLATVLLIGSGQKPLRVQLFGDSTMVGHDGELSRVVEPTPAVLLQRALDARFGRGRVIVESRAVSSTTSVQLIDGKDRRNKPWPASVAADLIVVNHGINDAHFGTPLPAYRANLGRFAAAGVPLILQTPVPGYGRDFPPPDEYAAAMREEAERLGVPVADVFEFFVSRPGWKNLVPDGVHPNAEGYALLVGEVLAPVVGDVLAELIAGSGYPVLSGLDGPESDSQNPPRSGIGDRNRRALPPVARHSRSQTAMINGFPTEAEWKDFVKKYKVPDKVAKAHGKKVTDLRKAFEKAGLDKGSQTSILATSVPAAKAFVANAAKVAHEFMRSLDLEAKMERSESQKIKERWAYLMLRQIENVSDAVKKAVDPFAQSRANAKKAIALYQAWLKKPDDTIKLCEMYGQGMRNHLGANINKPPAEMTPEVEKLVKDYQAIVSAWMNVLLDQTAADKIVADPKRLETLKADMKKLIELGTQILTLTKG